MPERRILLVLPCNPCVRLGDYSLCRNWRVILASLGDLVGAGLVDLAAIDSCKPGLVPWGEERLYRWCDVYPSSDRYYRREPWRLELMVRALEADLREALTRYAYIVYYVNVKAYREALRRASRSIPHAGRIIEAGPPADSPLSYTSKANREALRRSLLSLLEV